MGVQLRTTRTSDTEALRLWDRSKDQPNPGCLKFKNHSYTQLSKTGNSPKKHNRKPFNKEDFFCPPKRVSNKKLKAKSFNFPKSSKITFGGGDVAQW